MGMLREAIRAAKEEKEKINVPGYGDPAGNGEGGRFGVEKERRRVCGFLGSPSPSRAEPSPSQTGRVAVCLAKTFDLSFELRWKGHFLRFF